MVSVRKAWRRLMRLPTGQSLLAGQLADLSNNGNNGDTPTLNKPVSMQLMLTEPEENTKDGLRPITDRLSASTVKLEQDSHSISEFKPRKPHKRKQIKDREVCLMRGVYFKNMKWQAAIKVDKKQIHLGTVGTQEEAAHLYDRAAFMCGREPNFELSENEKQELKELNWDKFLVMTRSAITSKKHQRRRMVSSKRRSAVSSHHNSDMDGEQGEVYSSTPSE